MSAAHMADGSQKCINQIVKGDKVPFSLFLSFLLIFSKSFLISCVGCIISYRSRI
jgi:hypothetical protein